MLYVQKRSFLYYIPLAIVLLQLVPASFAMEPKRPALRIVRIMRNPQTGQLSTTVKSVQAAAVQPVAAVSLAQLASINPAPVCAESASPLVALPVAKTVAACLAVPTPNFDDVNKTGLEKHKAAISATKKANGHKAIKSTSSFSRPKAKPAWSKVVWYFKDWGISRYSRASNPTKPYPINRGGARKFNKISPGEDCDECFEEGNRETAKSSRGHRKPLLEGIIRAEDENHVIIDDPSNQQCIKINKVLPCQDVSKILKWDCVRYAARVKNWYNQPAVALATSIDACKKNRVKQKVYLKESYAMHRFSKLVDQYLCYGKQTKQSEGTYRIVIDGSVSALGKTGWQPCIFEYVFDRYTHECFHRNMKISQVKKSGRALTAPVTVPALCLDDI